MESLKYRQAARALLRHDNVDCIRLTNDTHSLSPIPSRDLSLRGPNLAAVPGNHEERRTRPADRFSRGSNLQKQRGHRARDRGSGAISNSASGQWLESAKATRRDEETREKETTTKEDVEIEKDKKKRDGEKEGGRGKKGQRGEGEVIRGCSGARKCPRPRGEKRVRVSLNNFDHTSRQSDTRAYEYIHLNAPRRPGKYCPNF